MTLPNGLATTSAQSTSQSAFYAALCLLDAPVLYSRMAVQELLNPTVHGLRSAVERRHLFPREYLKKVGIEDRRDINQVANYTLVAWRDNVEASDRLPAEYAPALERRFTAEELARIYELHGLPDAWYQLPYEEFLAERRRRPAGVIRQGFERLQRSLHL